MQTALFTPLTCPHLQNQMVLSTPQFFVNFCLKLKDVSLKYSKNGFNLSNHSSRHLSSPVLQLHQESLGVKELVVKELVVKANTRLSLAQTPGTLHGETP